MIHSGFSRMRSDPRLAFMTIHRLAIFFSDLFRKRREAPLFRTIAMRCQKRDNG